MSTGTQDCARGRRGERRGERRGKPLEMPAVGFMARVLFRFEFAFGFVRCGDVPNVTAAEYQSLTTSSRSSTSKAVEIAHTGEGSHNKNARGVRSALASQPLSLRGDVAAAAQAPSCADMVPELPREACRPLESSPRALAPWYSVMDQVHAPL